MAALWASLRRDPQVAYKRSKHNVKQKEERQYNDVVDKCWEYVTFKMFSLSEISCYVKLEQDSKKNWQEYIQQFDVLSSSYIPEFQERMLLKEGYGSCQSKEFTKAVIKIFSIFYANSWIINLKNYVPKNYIRKKTNILLLCQDSDKCENIESMVSLRPNSSEIFLISFQGIISMVSHK